MLGVPAPLVCLNAVPERRAGTWPHPPVHPPPHLPMTDPAHAPLLQAESLTKRFGANLVLQDVSVCARQGDVIAMIGSSGSGKSTFLRCLNLLEAPNAGRITVDGEPLHLVPGRDGMLKARDAAQLQRLRTRVAMVFQHFNLWAHMTALHPIHLQQPRKSFRLCVVV